MRFLPSIRRSCLLVLIAALPPAHAGATGHAAPAASASGGSVRAPDTVTREQDRDQMLSQLGIRFPTLPDKATDPNRPPSARPVDPAQPEGNWSDPAGRVVTRSSFGLWTNYEDAQAGAYPEIDLLALPGGGRVRTVDDWLRTQRPRLLRLAQEELWGVVPAETPAVSFTVAATEGDGYIEERITGAIDTAAYPQVRDTPRLLATLRRPAGARGPVPVVIVFAHPTFTRMDAYWAHVAGRGWAVCLLEAGALQPDDGRYLTSHLIGLVNRGHWRKPSDWGTLAAWGWGASRLLDHFESRPELDAGRVALAGHSRFGKAALVAMMNDPRFAAAFPSCSGALGAKLNRRHWGQDVENVAWDREYHWVAGNVFRWMGPKYADRYLPRRVEDLPVDGHTLLALCAPRPVFVTGGTDDSWSDPDGAWLAARAASPVYELLGKKGLVLTDAKPVPDVAYLEGRLGYRNHVGGHTDAPDWPAFLDFLERHLR